MPRVRVFHWKASEAGPLLECLRTAHLDVEYSDEFAEFRKARTSPPDAFVIDLTRLPSAGREVAVALRGSKATRHVPIVFVDGEAEKVAATRRVIPDAVYTRRDTLAQSLKTAIGKPVQNPFVPTQMMDRFANRSVVQKLGIVKDVTVAAVDAPVGYLKALGDAPEGVVFEECESGGPIADAKVTLWFLHDVPSFRDSLRQLRRAANRSRVWLLWRKAKRDGLDGSIIRSGIFDVGLVDYKICSFNDTWSAMVVAIRKTGNGK